MARLCFAAALGATLIGLCVVNDGTALAQSRSSEHAGRVRLLVLEAVPEFSSRVRGQVSDLDLTLDVETTASGSTRAEAEALVAERAARRAADVVAWLGELSSEGPAEAPRMTVLIWIVGHERIHSRPIGPRARTPSATDPRSDAAALSVAREARRSELDESSASLEAAALVVRSAVRAVSLERDGRTPNEPDEASHGAKRAPLAEPDAPSLGSSPTRPSRPARVLEARPRATAIEVDGGTTGGPERNASRRSSWSPRAGVDWSHAGLNPGGFWSASAGLDLHWGALSGGASASWGFAEPVAYRGVALELDRQTLLAELGGALLDSGGLVLRPRLGAGAAWLTRKTESTAWGGDLEPARTSLSALVSSELAAELELTGPFRLDLHGGLRWFAHSTRYVVDTPQGDVVLDAGWRWQPNAGVALGAVF
ncbi:MAG TPA: hypothetical protein VMG12_33165 [Polyangiaceae bacterium]|nr:hypothetical protein [Polyangiaceae bacterium]